MLNTRSISFSHCLLITWWGEGGSLLRVVNSGIQYERAANQHFKHYQSPGHRERPKSGGYCTAHICTYKEVIFINFIQLTRPIPPQLSNVQFYFATGRKRLGKFWWTLSITPPIRKQNCKSCGAQVSNMALLPGKYRQFHNTMDKFSNDIWNPNRWLHTYRYILHTVVSRLLKYIAQKISSHHEQNNPLHFTTRASQHQRWTTYLLFLATWKTRKV